MPVGGRSLPVDPDDLERGVHFVHDLAMNALGTADRVEALVEVLVGALAARGLVDPIELAALVPPPEARPRQAYQPSIVVRIGETPPKAEIVSPDIDCQALLPICQARCCRLTVHLAYEDLEDGFAWVFERPYELRRDPDTGYCTHYDAGCARYDTRPGGCRVFDCRADARIWVDFDQRIPAPLEATDTLYQIRKR